SVTSEWFHSIGASEITREKTPPGPGSRYAGILKIGIAAAHSATIATNVRGGSRFQAIRLARRNRFDFRGTAGAIAASPAPTGASTGAASGNVLVRIEMLLLARARDGRAR